MSDHERENETMDMNEIEKLLRGKNEEPDLTNAEKTLLRTYIKGIIRVYNNYKQIGFNALQLILSNTDSPLSQTRTALVVQTLLLHGGFQYAYSSSRKEYKINKEQLKKIIDTVLGISQSTPSTSPSTPSKPQ